MERIRNVFLFTIFINLILLMFLLYFPMSVELQSLLFFFLLPAPPLFSFVTMLIYFPLLNIYDKLNGRQLW